jgi:hypothetical protein
LDPLEVWSIDEDWRELVSVYSDECGAVGTSLREAIVTSSQLQLQTKKFSLLVINVKFKSPNICVQ